METPESSAAAGSVAIAEQQEPMISIVVPAFNEAGRIEDSIREIDAFIRRSPWSFEVIVVDDGSTDDTADIVSRFQLSCLRLLRNNGNRGKGYTVRQGVLAAKGKYVLFTDADLSAPIEEAEKLLDAVAQQKGDVIIGSRAVDRSYIERHQPRFRELAGILFNIMVRFLLGLNVRDTQCGFKLFDREKTRRIFEQLTTLGFGFDPEVLFLAKRFGLRVCEVPVRWSHSEGSKVRVLQDSIRMFLDLVRIRWNALAGRYS